MKMYKHLKRILDLVIILSSSPLIIFFIVFISFLVLIFDGMPIFYKGERVGQNYKPFKMLKFRTMKINSNDIRNIDGTTFNSLNDKRLTRLGRLLRLLSLDEIPQFLNVFLGQMSIVGPRPDLNDQVQIYDNFKLSKKRFLVKPGITGLAQINGRNNIDLIERTKFDDYYVENMSFFLDLKIIIMTFLRIFNFKVINRK